MNRRKFLWLSSILGTSVMTAPALAQFQNLKDSTKIDGMIESNSSVNSIISNDIVVSEKLISPIFPPLLKQGSKIAFASPASTTNTWELSKNIKLFKSLGFEVVLGKIVKEQSNKFAYLSAPDEERADEFNNLVKDNSINAIISSRGGFGTMRMIDLIDFEAIKLNPKIYLGFSDFTFVLNAISKLSNIVTYHGPVGVSSFTNFTKENFQKVLVENNQKQVELVSKDIVVLKEGTAEGKLVGGNLSMLVASLGTRFEFDSSNAIMFIEEVSEDSYKIDRMLTHLKLAGKFDSVKGIVLGEFKNIKKRKPFYPNYGYSLLEVFEQTLLPLGVPTILNFPIGHISDQVTLPILAHSFLDTSKKSLKINLT